MKILIDMNLSPAWVPTLENKGIETIHRSRIGQGNAPDKEIFSYARAADYIVFTHDLDFGDILAATSAASPSVIQLRSEDTSPEVLIVLFVNAIQQFRSQLENGALITIEPDRLRARILPIEATEN
jgi:predicted nuclease of predicted toxin-antitoxin system